MNKRLLASVVGLLAGAGLAGAQVPYGYYAPAASYAGYGYGYSGYPASYGYSGYGYGYGYGQGYAAPYYPVPAYAPTYPQTTTTYYPPAGSAPAYPSRYPAQVAPQPAPQAAELPPVSAPPVLRPAPALSPAQAPEAPVPQQEELPSRPPAEAVPTESIQAPPAAVTTSPVEGIPAPKEPPTPTTTPDAPPPTPAGSPKEDEGPAAASPPAADPPQVMPAPAPSDGPKAMPPGRPAENFCPSALGEAFGGTGNQEGPRLWVTADYLLWKLKSATLPPLLTEGDQAAALALGVPTGAFGSPGTALISPDKLSFNMASGGRLTLGAWLDGDRRFGLLASGFLLQQITSRFQFDSGLSTGTTAVAIPFFDVATNTETAALLTDPLGVGGTAATVRIEDKLRLGGADLNGMFRVYENSWCSVAGLVGFRYVDLAESFLMNSTTTVPGPVLAGSPIPPGAFFSLTDHFATRNQFYGGQLGARGEVRWGNFFLNGTAKVALGTMVQTVSINGSDVSNFDLASGTLSSVPTTLPVGLFAQTSNTGHFAKQDFTVVPEVNVQIGWQFWNRVRLFAGYNFLYLSSVARAPDQINRNLNASNFPGGLNFPFASTLPTTLTTPLLPNVPLHTSSFWAQGVNFGLGVTF